jgi:Zn-dependent membrane protease YugP
MRYYFFWNEPYHSVVSFFFQFSWTFFILAISLPIPILARRRIGRARAGASISPADFALDGAGFASKILETTSISGWTIVRGTGPLANFTDPARRELRLSAAVAGRQTLEALAIASHQAGQAIQDSRWRWVCRGRAALILGAKLAVGVAWLTLIAGFLMLTPFLTDRGAFLSAGALVALLVLQMFEADANRRALLAIRQAGLDESWTVEEREAFGKALEAARWVEIASALPIP